MGHKINSESIIWQQGEAMVLSVTCGLSKRTANPFKSINNRNRHAADDLLLAHRNRHPGRPHTLHMEETGRKSFRISRHVHVHIHIHIHIQYNTIQYNTIQYNKIQYNTIQYNTIQYNPTQYNAIQYNTIH